MQQALREETFSLRKCDDFLATSYTTARLDGWKNLSVAASEISYHKIMFFVIMFFVATKNMNFPNTRFSKCFSCGICDRLKVKTTVVETNGSV